MRLDNRTRYRTADIERAIQLALDEREIYPGAAEIVRVVYSGGAWFSGVCWVGGAKRWPKRGGRPTMTLRLPRPGVALSDGVDWNRGFAWLVRHEVAHWAGLGHRQMNPMLSRWKNWRQLGCQLPDWCATIDVTVEALEPEPPRKAKKPLEDVRLERAVHARQMLAKAARKAKLAATIEKRWRRRVACAERSIAVAAAKPTGRT